MYFVTGRATLLDMATIRIHEPAEALRVLNVQQVADLLGLAVRTVWRMSTDGDFPTPVRLSPKRVGWRLGAVEQWLDERQREALAGVS